jgi:hypothetical protein
MSVSNHRLSLLLVVVLIAGFSRSAHASFYLDPGSGSYVIQFVLSGAFALLLATKSLWRRALTIFRKSPRESQRT